MRLDEQLVVPAEVDCHLAALVTDLADYGPGPRAAAWELLAAYAGSQASWARRQLAGLVQPALRPALRLVVDGGEPWEGWPDDGR